MNTRTRKIFSKLLTLFFSLLVISANSFASDLSVMHPYARAVPEGHPNSAAFMVIKNSGNEDRALVNARSNISKVVELHTHKKEKGMMRMRRVDQIDVKAGSKTVLKPGGLHVMFIGLKQQLKVGDKVDLELVFDNGQTMKLSVPVKKVKGMMHKKKH